MSLDDADKIVPQLKLAKMIQGLAPADKTPSGIILMAPEYMKNLSTILSGTSKQVLLTHLLWKQIQAFSSYVEADAVAPLKQFTNELQGKVRSNVIFHPTSIDRDRTQTRHQNDGEPALDMWTTGLAGF